MGGSQRGGSEGAARPHCTVGRNRFRHTSEPDFGPYLKRWELSERARQRCCLSGLQALFSNFGTVAELKRHWGLVEDSIEDWDRLWKWNPALQSCDAAMAF
jgi:hypothetical protein